MGYCFIVDDPADQPPGNFSGTLGPDNSPSCWGQFLFAASAPRVQSSEGADALALTSKGYAEVEGLKHHILVFRAKL
jgi:hypothetical protein